MPQSRLLPRARRDRTATRGLSMAGKSITVSELRARADAQVPPRLGIRIVAVFALFQLLLLLLLLLLYPSAAGAAAPVSGQVSVSTKDGYARIVFTLSEETDA